MKEDDLIYPYNATWVTNQHKDKPAGLCFFVGKPMPTTEYSIRELELMGIVGIYTINSY